MTLEQETLSIERLTAAIQDSQAPIDLLVDQSGETTRLTINPELGLGTDGAPAIGIGMAYAQFTRDNFGQGIVSGWQSLKNMT